MVSRLVRCPECRADHFVPREGADGFPTNITLSGFLDLPAQRNGTPSDSSQATEPAGGSPSKCGVCETESQTIKCFHCNKMVCESCKRSHTGQMKVDIGRLLNQIRRGLPKLSNSISAVEQKSEQMKTRAEAVKSEIHDTIERYIKELRDREKMLHSEMDTYLQGEQRSLRIFQENIEVELASISSYCDSTESMMNQADNNVLDADLVNIKKQCTDYMDQIRETESSEVPSIREINFTFDGQPVHSSVMGFGQLNITTPGTSNRSTTNSNAGASATNRNSAGQSQANRPRWSDVEPLDTAMFDDFSVAPSFSYTPRTRAHSPPSTRMSNRTQYTRPTHSSLELGRHPAATIGHQPGYHSAATLSQHPSMTVGYQPDLMAPSPRHMPSRTNDYMFSMESPMEEDLVAIMDRNRMEEINRRRIRGTSRGNSTLGRLARGRPQERVSGLIGGGGGGATIGATSRGRGITPRATSPTYPTAAAVTQQSEVVSALTAALAADAAERRVRATNPTVHTDARPAAAFIVPLNGGPVQTIQRADSAEQSDSSRDQQPQIPPEPETSSSQDTSSSQQPTVPAETESVVQPEQIVDEHQVTVQPEVEQPEAHTATVVEPEVIEGQTEPLSEAQQSELPPPAPQQGNGRRPTRRNKRQNSRQNRTGNSNSQRRPAANSSNDNRRPPVTNAESNATQPNGSSSETATTSQAQVNVSPSSSQNNANNNSNVNNEDTSATPNPTRSSSPSSAGLGSRSRTFVREDGPENTSTNLPMVNGMSSTFDIPLTETIGDLDTSELSRISVEDSINGIRPINNYRRKGGMKKKIGNDRGNAESQFTWPRGVAASPINDSIVVADSSNHRVQMFDLAGHYVSMFGSYGQGNGEFDCLAGIAVNTMGQIVIADRYNHRIQVFDRYGQFSHKFGEEGTADGKMNYPWGVACDRGGFIYVCDKENHRIQVFQANGTFVRKFGKLGNRPGQLENPHYITVGHDGNIIVSDCNNHRLQVFSDTGRFVKAIGKFGSDNGQLKYPKGVAVDRQGFIIVADSGNNRIQVFRGDGRFYSVFGSWGTCNGQFKGLEGIALTNNGDIVVSDKENHRIQIF